MVLKFSWIWSVIWIIIVRIRLELRFLWLFLEIIDTYLHVFTNLENCLYRHWLRLLRDFNLWKEKICKVRHLLSLLLFCVLNAHLNVFFLQPDWIWDTETSDVNFRNLLNRHSRHPRKFTQDLLFEFIKCIGSDDSFV